MNGHSRILVTSSAISSHDIFFVGRKLEVIDRIVLKPVGSRPDALGFGTAAGISIVEMGRVHPQSDTLLVVRRDVLPSGREIHPAC